MDQKAKLNSMIIAGAGQPLTVGDRRVWALNTSGSEAMVLVFARDEDEAGYAAEEYLNETLGEEAEDFFERCDTGDAWWTITPVFGPIVERKS